MTKFSKWDKLPQKCILCVSGIQTSGSLLVSEFMHALCWHSPYVLFGKDWGTYGDLHVQWTHLTTDQTSIIMCWRNVSTAIIMCWRNVSYTYVHGTVICTYNTYFPCNSGSMKYALNSSQRQKLAHSYIKHVYIAHTMFVVFGRETCVISLKTS